MKLRFRHKRLYARNPAGDYAAALHEFEVDLIDDSGKVIGSTQDVLDGKLGVADSPSNYLRELELA